MDKLGLWLVGERSKEEPEVYGKDWCFGSLLKINKSSSYHFFFILNLFRCQNQQEYTIFEPLLFIVLPFLSPSLKCITLHAKPSFRNAPKFLRIIIQIEHRMWQLSEPNKVIAQKMKVLSYQKHRSSLKNIKPGITLSTPWQPTFSLSKRCNKYHRFVANEIVKQNENLLSRMLKIETEPMKNTINVIPRTVPSNKQTFLELKARERRVESRNILRENMKIIDKLENVNSDYNLQTLSSQWKQNLRYRDIVTKKESVPDYLQMAKQYQKLEKSRMSRPRTAFVNIDHNEEDYDDDQ